MEFPPFAPTGIATKRQLVSAGWHERHLTEAVRTGRLVRLRNGWYAVPTASAPDVVAVRAGGRLTSTSLTRELGLWTVDDSRIHVALPTNAARLRPITPNVVRHWGHPVVSPPQDSSRDTLANALVLMIKRLPLEDSTVTVDSALNSGLLTTFEWTEALSCLTPYQQRISAYVDGRSQSGLETRCRIALRKRGVRLQIQVPIEGVGIVDVLIGERLVLELDGRRFHDDPAAFESDRRRDLALARRGYRVIRLSYAQVMNNWGASEAVIVRLIRAGEHLWRPSARKFYE